MPMLLPKASGTGRSFACAPQERAGVRVCVWRTRMQGVKAPFKLFISPLMPAAFLQGHLGLLFGVHPEHGAQRGLQRL